MSLIAIPFLLSFFLKYKYRQISYIFILLISIGVMQGLCENIALITGVDNIQWGTIKALLIVSMFLLLLFDKSNFKKKLPFCLLVWSACFVCFSLIITWHVFEATNNNYSINVFNVIQNFSLLNMLMVYVVFFSYKEKLVNPVVDMLIAIGKIVSVFAILQWIAFKYFVNSILLAIVELRGFNRLDGDDGGGIRVFSFFSTHYGLSAFLIIITVLYVARSLFCNRGINYFTLLLLIVAHILTFNLTGILLTFCGCIFTYFIYIYSCRRSFNYIFKTMKMAALVIVIVVFTLTLISDFRQRIYGISNQTETSSGAGYSLYLRNQFIHTEFNLLAANPLGIGLSLTDIAKENSIDLGYVRTGIINDVFSSDAWFLWLIVQVGLLSGLILLSIYIIPLVIGLLNFKSRTMSERWQICAFSSLLLVIFVGCMSNSPILTYPPSNILIWCAVGAIFAIASRKNATLRHMT